MRDLLDVQPDSVEKIAESINTPEPDQIVESINNNPELVPTDNIPIDQVENAVPENVIPEQENIFLDDQAVDVAGPFKIPKVDPGDIKQEVSLY